MLSGRVALVTGASRGIGRGVALQLGEAGATVYVTGRNAKDLERTCQEIRERGGKPHAVVVDHAKDAQVLGLFDRIAKEQNGRLDLCVNNAYAAGEMLFKDTIGKPFWEQNATVTWDACNDVGLRNHYLCSVYASRLMVPRKSGLIVNVSSAAGLVYFLSVPYGIGKTACDRMASDCAHELKRHNVAMISLWPGPVKTEFSMDYVIKCDEVDAMTKRLLGNGESVEFVGKAVTHLAAEDERKIMKKSGCIHMTYDLAKEYGFKDVDGSMPGDPRSVKTQFQRMGWHWTASIIPGFIRAPLLSMHFVGYKFRGFKWILDMLRV